MRTKLVGFLLVLVLGLSLAGCDTYKASFAGDDGIRIITQGVSESQTQFAVHVGSDTYLVKDDGETLHWYYDRKPGEVEYVIVISSDPNFDHIRYINIHLLASKKPGNFK